LLIAQIKVINETFLKLFAVKAQPYFKKPCISKNLGVLFNIKELFNQGDHFINLPFYQPLERPYLK
jgi:hypothetical protein